VSSFATSVGISSSGWWAAGHHPLDEAEKGLQGFAAEMFSGRTRIIGEQEEAGRAYLGGWRPPGAADVLPAAGEDGRSGVEVGGPERVGPRTGSPAGRWRPWRAPPWPRRRPPVPPRRAGGGGARGSAASRAAECGPARARESGGGARDESRGAELEEDEGRAGRQSISVAQTRQRARGARLEQIVGEEPSGRRCEKGGRRDSGACGVSRGKARRAGETGLRREAWRRGTARRGGRRRGVETRRARRRPDLERRGGEARCAGEAAGGAEFDLGLRRGGEARRARGRPKLERRGGGRSWSEARRRPERSELELVRRRRAGERGGRGQDCGLISLKFEVFFCKTSGKRTIWAIRSSDQTAGSGWRRGTLPGQGIGQES